MNPVLQYILYAAAAVTALGVLWTKLIRPTLEFYATAREMVPLLKVLTSVFKGNPQALSVLDDIARQFKSDSGSTLKDQVNRLEALGKKQEVANQKAEDNAARLSVGVETQRQLAEDDRRQLRELMVQLGVNAQAVAALSKNVEAIQRDARSVATDLAHAHKRADEHPGDEPGAAADAAARQTTKEKLQTG